MTEVDPMDPDATDPDDGSWPSFEDDSEPDGLKLEGNTHNDDANALRLVEWHGAFVRYATDIDKWYGWDGKVWVRNKAPVTLAARRVGPRLEREARSRLASAVRKADGAGADPPSEDEQPKKRAKVLKTPDEIFAAAELKHAVQSRNAGRIEAMIKLASADPRVAVPLDAFDADLNTINTQNGIVDLRTGRLTPHTPGHMMSRITNAEYHPRATCPTWEWLIDYAMGSDRDLIGFLRRYVGYILTGHVTEQCLLFNHGVGNNGKSVIMGALAHVLGTYAVAAPRPLLVIQRNEPHPAELLRLRGARMALCAEVTEDMQLDEAKLKDLTGGDKIAARGMGENFLDYTPTAKLVLNGNHLPKIRGTDHGQWRRWRMVPWNVVATTVDKSLPAKLAAEAEGILAYAVAAAQEWYARGLEAPPGVLAATSAFRESSDELGDFFARRVEFAPDARIARKQLWHAYKSDCEDNGAKPMESRTFCARLRARGCRDVKVRHMGTVTDGWAGIALRELTLDAAEGVTGTLLS